MPTPSEHDKALTDLLEYGQNYMDNGRHLPLDNVIQQAEPVAWMTEITAYDPPARCTHGTVKSAQNYQEGAGGPARCRIVPLYTPPAPAPVVPEDIARDANRYRWLRDPDNFPADEGNGPTHWDELCDLEMEDFDKYIDATMEQPK